MWSRLFIATLSLLSLAIGMGGPTPMTVTDPRAVVSADDTAERKLDLVLPEVRFDALPLEQAVRKLGKLADLNVVLDYSALAASGIEADKPITLRLVNVTLRGVLKSLSAIVSMPTAPLDYDVEENVVFVTTEDAIVNSRKFVGIYPVNDLIERMASQYRTRRLGTPQPGGLLGRAADSEDDYVRAIEDLIKVVYGAIPYEESVGGSRSSVSELNGRLVITHTRRSHCRIAVLLEVLRMGESLPPATRPAAFRP